MIEAESIEFRWGKKRGVGGKKKDVQFYESFTYDGDDYTLYDSVYLWNRDETEPYIGKVIKIWEMPNKARRVKILWFFRPCEISNYLETEKTLENELFLASGEGVGLANVNPLEAIAGKCCIVCTSNNDRNPQPSDEELQGADFIFYRTFDVGKCVISDKIDEKVAGIEAKFLLNRAGGQESSVGLKLDSEKRNLGINDVVVHQAAILPKLNLSGECETVMIDGTRANASIAKNSEEKGSLARQKSSLGETHTSSMHELSAKISKSDHQKEETSIGKISFNSKDDTVKSESKVSDVVTQVPLAGKAKATEDTGEFDDRPFKKAKLESYLKITDVKNTETVQKLSHKYDSSVAKAVICTTTASDEKSNVKLAKDPQGNGNDRSKILQHDENLAKLTNGNLAKESSHCSSNKVSKTDYHRMEVTRRPDDGKSKWFKISWEENMKRAHQQGTLVLLRNLEPSCTSAEVEDIVWHAFKESCTARMVQQTAISSPHFGQAFVIFRTRQSAEMAVTKLNDGCLLLPNGRPLVGSIASPCFTRKQSTFFGHLNIRKTRLQMQRETKEAISTSHCSQPNTLEYDMAMEWCLLQERSDIGWKNLHKQQGEALRKLRAILKSKRESLSLSSLLNMDGTC